MTEEKKSEPMFGIYESELCRAIHGIDDAMECHNLKKKICARGTIEQAPATNENHFVINDTLITAIGEWDKGPHNIVKILELLRACPLAEHDAAIAAQAIVEDRKRPRPPCEECHWQARQHWKLLESVPDKNGLVVFGAKEDPNGHFVSREKAIEFMQIEDGRIKERIAQARKEGYSDGYRDGGIACTIDLNILRDTAYKIGAAAERERVLPFLDELISPSVSDARKREIVESLRQPGQKRGGE